MRTKKAIRKFIKNYVKRNPLLSLLSYAVAKGIAISPRWLRQCFVIFCLTLLLVIPHPYRKISRHNLRKFFPQLNPLRIELLVYKSMFQALSILFDIFAMWFRGKEWTAQQVKKVHNEQLINESLKNNRNVIFVSYHFGNWEILAPYLTAKYRCYSIYKEVSNPYYNALVQRYRTSCDIIGVSVDSSILIKKIIKNLRTGTNDALMFMPDQRPQKGSAYVMADFFGAKTPFNTMSGKLITLVNCDVILICGLSCGGGNYEIFMSKPPQDIYDKDPLVVLNAMNKGYEELINLDPAQYNWLQDKFKYARRAKRVRTG